VSNEIRIEIVFADADTQCLKELTLPGGSTVENAVTASGLQSAFPGYDFGELPVGVWGKIVSPDRQLRSGDRVEVYRELEMDPMEARRIRALAPDPGPSESH
jgi:hypothetical protein